MFALLFFVDYLASMLHVNLSEAASQGDDNLGRWDLFGPKFASLGS